MTATKRFKWVDRDTAASDLLQLAYHAPLHISRLALDLQQAIRSTTIANELQAIALDPDRDEWERRYAMRALAALPGDITFPALSHLLSDALTEHLSKLELDASSHIRTQIRTIEQHIDYLEEVCSLIYQHPSNFTWFLEALDNIHNPIVRRYLLLAQIPDAPSQDVLHEIDLRLSALFAQRPELLTFCAIERITTYHDGWEFKCLTERLDTIAELCVKEHDSKPRSFYCLLRDWPELQAAVQAKLPELEHLMRAMREQLHVGRVNRNQPLPDYKETAIYKKLKAMYLQAATGDPRALHNLLVQARGREGEIPVRALATHFIGLLHSVEQRHPGIDILATLYFLLRHVVDDWGLDGHYSPIRTEAARALHRIGSPQAWEILVSSFFINPRNVLSDFLNRWIADLTDQLSTDRDRTGTEERAVMWFGSQAPWLSALTRVDTDDTDL